MFKKVKNRKKGILIVCKISTEDRMGKLLPW